MVPEQRQQQDDRNWNAQQPKQNTAAKSHILVSLSSRSASLSRMLRVTLTQKPGSGSYSELMGQHGIVPASAAHSTSVDFKVQLSECVLTTN
jgi:hypothetical protein